MGERQPAAAGRFYPFDKSALRSKIRNCFEHDLGPGNVPEGGVTSGFAGGIVPHAGMDYSGPCAAHVYEMMVESGIPEVVVIFGTMHYSRKDFVADDRDYRTPLGTVENVYDDIDIGIDVDRSAHDREHSIEVQLPFIQYFSDDFKILPVGVSTTDNIKLEELAESIRSSLDGKDTVFIASTDFTHCGPRYGQPVPETMSPGKFAEEQDRKALNMISKGDAEGFLEVLRRQSISMCGPGGVAGLMDVFEGEEIDYELLCHYSSFDMVGGQNAVGYAGVSFSR